MSIRTTNYNLIKPELKDPADITVLNENWEKIDQTLKNHGRHVPSTCVTIEDWNDAVENGWYMGNDAENAPYTGTWFFGHVIAHNSSYVFQEVYQFTKSSDATLIGKHIRAKMNGTWGNWTEVTIQRDVPGNAKLQYISTLKSDAQDQLDNKMYLRPANIEFNTPTDVDNGGFIDFHYNGNTSDYTSRIIEDSKGVINVIGGLKNNGNLVVTKGDVVNNLTSTSTNVPLSAYQGKLLNNNKVAKSDIVNNLTSTDTTKPLSAAQGKVLNDKIPTLPAVTKLGTMGTTNTEDFKYNMSSLDDGIYLFSFASYGSGTLATTKGVCAIIQKHTVGSLGTFLSVLSNQTVTVGSETKDFASVSGTEVTLKKFGSSNYNIYLKKL